MSPIDDPKRLEVLRATRLLDSPSEEVFDRITRLAQRLTRAPITLLTLVDLDRQFVKSAQGLAEPVATDRATPLSHSFCQHVVASGAPLVLSDARTVPALAGNLAVPEMGVIAYAGVPLMTASGAPLGALCAIDTEPRDWTPDDLEVLDDLAGIANGEIDRRLAATTTTDARGLERELTRLAFHDPLTGLPNRMRLELDLEQALERARRAGYGIGVLYLDLDNFKHINDSLGHATGDDLLRAVAARLSASARRTDLVARLGGDEFIVVADLVDDPEQGAAELARKLIDSLRAPFEIADYELLTGTSVGIALFPRDGATAPELLKRADAAMYEAKNEGRGTFAFRRPGSADESDLLALTGQLRRAVGDGELVLHYQPVFELVTNAPVSVEALVRWDHPERGLLPPAEFIPAAERSGLIDGVGAWVLGAAAAQARRWHDAGLDFPIAVNVSPRELRRDDVAARIAGAIAHAGIDPQLLTIEVTEAAAMTGRGGSLDVLHEIHATGVRIAIDDFGAGYSSLARLRAMPADVLKIDRSFLRDVPGDTAAGHIVTAIIRLANALEVDTVAEGIETEAQLAFLRARGCPLGQGYRLSKPLTAEGATELLLRARAALV